MQTKFRDHLFQFVTGYITEFGTSPSFAEITSAMGISPRSKSLISRNLRILAKEGKLVLSKSGRRLLITLPMRRLPLVGKVSAGFPLETISEIEYIDINYLFEGDDNFALMVRGTSMVNEGILDGDIIFCRKSKEAKEGDIVVASIDNENTTLKRISYEMEGMITLIPANPKLKPKRYAPERISVQGIYIGLVRVHE